ncbi:hypothetical protein GF367_02235 [Candidatus Woesearchaeota archaeon]|nr:hypothetical protein [Candidatus Woesearchaeota archaeon]
MGFGNVATTIILFIAVMLLATGVIITINNHVQQSQDSMKIQADALNNQIKTSILITEVNYTSGNLVLYITNDGKTTLKTSKVDVFVDADFIPRNTTGRNITIEPSTDTTNPGLWDPDEVLKINVTKTLDAGQHRVAVTTQYGNKDEELFST